MNVRTKTFHNKKRGAAIITAVLLFVVISLAVVFGLSSSVAREYVTARDFAKSKGAYYLSEAGTEDAIYRIKNSKPISLQEILSLSGNFATTSISDVNSSTKSINSLGSILFNTRRVSATLTTSTGESFSYGVQAGSGGVDLQNSSSITGSIFSEGPITGTNNIITGTVISGGSTGTNGLVSGIITQGTSSVYAGTIQNSNIAGSAYCNTIMGSNIGSCKTLNAQPPQPLPISDQDVANYETNAAAGGIATCSGGQYSITSAVSIGPKKIPCDLNISGSAVVNLTGPLWVVGNISISNNVQINVDPALGGAPNAAVVVPVVADPGVATRATDGTIILRNSTSYNQKSGSNSNAYVMLLSANTGATVGNGINAIDVQNSAQGKLLVYAGHGNINLQNNVQLQEVTGYKITLQNAANVVYASGLQNTLFTSGPGGSWSILDWKEGQ